MDFFCGNDLSITSLVMLLYMERELVKVYHIGQGQQMCVFKGFDELK